ncbi:hypothetical protein BV25DRAFT_1840911 [Artomyces pyxidatus]|uniref:Uncharacterized protein n=1 Tax=Artomyces pyxidatus TaxID=48021 RepID=A0ACB8SPV0_9AGAM|nr:hypothetical protein BV25DRAFT_1840911 [Artomyces pyxidatus]
MGVVSVDFGSLLGILIVKMATAGSAVTSESSRKKQTLSPWIPISLLAIATAALAVPLVMIRKQRGAAHKLSNAPPVRHSVPRHPTARAAESPPRRVARSPMSRPLPKSATPVVIAEAHSPGTARRDSESQASGRSSQDVDFNGALYTLGAFGIATALVTAGGAAGVWGVKRYLGVKDIEEFASVMRQTLLSKMPVLASRIHRATQSDPLPPFTLTPSPVSSSPSPHTPTSLPPYPESWNWAEARRRLTEAFEQGGVSRWAEVAAGELEAEAEAERRARGI